MRSSAIGPTWSPRRSTDPTADTARVRAVAPSARERWDVRRRLHQEGLTRRVPLAAWEGSPHPSFRPTSRVWPTRSSWSSSMPKSSTSTSWMDISYRRSRWGRSWWIHCGPYTERTLHGHLMVDAPEQFFEELADAGLDVVSFHHEAVGDPEPAIAKARAAGLKVGLTLNMETPVEAVFPVLDQVDDVMLMSIRPGWSGQTLNPDVYPRLAQVRSRDRPAGLVGRPRDRRRRQASTTPGLPSTRAPRS